MTYDTEDQVISIGYFEKHSINESDLSIHILDSEHLFMLVASRLPIHLQSLIIILSWTLFFVGSYFKFIIYKYMLEQHREKMSKAIDILIFVLAITQHFYQAMSVTERTLRFSE